MPLSENDFREPKLTKYQTRYPLTTDKKDRYNTINPRTDMARYAGDRDTGWKQAGYNPNHQSTRIERINLLSDEISLKPY